MEIKKKNFFRDFLNKNTLLRLFGTFNLKTENYNKQTN